MLPKKLYGFVVLLANFSSLWTALQHYSATVNPQPAIALTKDGHYHARTKHIDIRYHFICYIIEEGTIKLIYCPTDDMTADTLTKALPSVKAKHFATALGLSTV